MTAFNVAISAGHHPGARGATRDGVTEYDLAVEWVDEIISRLERDVIDPYLHMFVHKIETGKLPHKVEQVNAIKRCDLAIEIHFNAAGDPGVRGCETLYYPGSEKGMEAAMVFQNVLPRAMQNRSRGVKEGWYKQDRPGKVDFDGDVDGDEVIAYWLRKTTCTSLILEPEFIASHKLIRERQTEGCAAIAQAVGQLALRKHELNNLPPEERPSGIR